MASALNPHLWKASGSGSSYNLSRPPYPPWLWKRLLELHTSTGGETKTLIDLGCGPGTVLRHLADSFGEAIGVDVSEDMFSAAPLLKNVTYQMESASSLPFARDDSTDLVTAGTAAHWFDHEKWWSEMTRVVQSKGSVAVFTFGPGFLVDDSSPQVTAVYPPSLLELLRVTQRYSGPFRAFRSAGNQHTFSLYDNLPGPSSSAEWELQPKRFRWGWRDGAGYGADEPGCSWEVKEAEKGTEEEQLDMHLEMTLDQLLAYYLSVSPVMYYRNTLKPGEEDWLWNQVEAVKRDLVACGLTESTPILVRRVFALVIWKRK